MRIFRAHLHHSGPAKAAAMSKEHVYYVDSAAPRCEGVYGGRGESQGVPLAATQHATTRLAICLQAITDLVIAGCNEILTRLTRSECRRIHAISCALVLPVIPPGPGELKDA